MFVGLLCLITLTITESATEGGSGGRRIRRRSPVDVSVGVILDLNSSLGHMALNCTNFGLQDFYSTNDPYTTKLRLLFRDSRNDVLTAASVARDLIIKEKVQAILGPQNSEQARFVVELGFKYHVPVIWFPPSGPSLLPPRSRFFIHSYLVRSHCFQFRAIAAIIEAYNWQSVIPIYEEPEFGYDLIPCLTYAMEEMDTRVPYISAINQNFNETQVENELKKFKDKRTYVFLVHMTVELWSRLVKVAYKAGMMSKGYAWILTQGLSSVMDPEAKDIKVKGYMDGALGVGPSVVSNKNDIISKRRYVARRLLNYNKTLSLYGLWAYDTVTALANAVENSGLVNYNESRVDLVDEDLGMRNETGQKLRRAIMHTNFPGLSGNFSLWQGQLKPSTVVVYNVKGLTDTIIGSWSPRTGLARYKLMDPIRWPGNTTDRPPKLKIGVPKTHFTEFVDVSGEWPNMSFDGFAIHVFKKVVDVLPFPLNYEFVPVNINAERTPSSYDDLLCSITDKNVDVDVIIGDVTIVANRTNCVDFTLPYLDSSVSMVVKVRSDTKSRWILFKPFDWLLWLILGVIFVGATVIVIILEKKTKADPESQFQNFVRNPFLIYMSDIGSLKSGTSKWVVIVITFLLGLALQVYTANLTSILTERTTAKPSPWRDVQEIKRNNLSVGYQKDSWVKGLLIHQLGLNEEQLKPYASPDEYNHALSTKKDGVDVIFDEIPYLTLFLSSCPSCKMTGPIYKSGGFSFAFPKNSTLVLNFSAAILNVTQNVTTFRNMKKEILLPVTIDRSEYKSDVEMRSLKIDDFGGLFPIALFVLVLFFSLSILRVLKVPPITPWLHKKLVPFSSA
ncbi:glutamate receptor 2.9-like [Prosopis cineraria]|uniref:glutamate receptor 2.9-like n=1 Tax=Prosopis cineraria TaxID=364024 RepID=UPI00241067D8|nr:glutamate receptor 2.9-like [Prosopis cineraria]